MKFFIVAVFAALSWGNAFADCQNGLIESQKKVIELQNPRLIKKLRFESTATSYEECETEIKNTVLVSKDGILVQPWETFGGSRLVCHRCSTTGDDICRSGNTYYYYMNITTF